MKVLFDDRLPVWTIRSCVINLDTKCVDECIRVFGEKLRTIGTNRARKIVTRPLPRSDVNAESFTKGDFVYHGIFERNHSCFPARTIQSHTHAGNQTCEDILNKIENRSTKNSVAIKGAYHVVI